MPAGAGESICGVQGLRAGQGAHGYRAQGATSARLLHRLAVAWSTALLAAITMLSQTLTPCLAWHAGLPQTAEHKPRLWQEAAGTARLTWLQHKNQLVAAVNTLVLRQCFFQCCVSHSTSEARHDMQQRFISTDRADAVRRLQDENAMLKAQLDAVKLQMTTLQKVQPLVASIVACSHQAR
jgi:hypothetical protein